MPRVDFYILDTHGPQAAQRFACRLAEKAWKAGHQVFVHTGSSEEARAMDELLWTFRAESFVPHGLSSRARAADLPVLVGEGSGPQDAQLEVLINLAPTVPEFFSQAARVAEIVVADSQSKAQGRDRFRVYRDQGCEMRDHKLSG